MRNVLVWLNRLLTANFFLVLVLFVWFVVAAIGENLKVHLGWHLWQQLWQPLIQPAVGLVMLGAIGSGILSRFTKDKDFQGGGAS